MKETIVERNVVALLAEGVDRNITLTYDDNHVPGSPSSRRAWIEIRMRTSKTTNTHVALLAEGVDRNPAARLQHHRPDRRPPRGGRG